MNDPDAMQTPDADPRVRTQRLVLALTETLTPIRVAPPRVRAALVWLILGLGLAAAAIRATGPMRPGWTTDASQPGFVFQLALGATAAFVAVLVGLDLDVPGIRRPRALLVLLLGLGLAWLASTVFPDGWPSSLAFDQSAPSMLGKREHCLIEGLAIAVGPALIALWLLAGRTPRPGFTGGAALGFAAGMLPALAMQLACLPDPTHALRFHLPPVAFAALASGLAARFALPRG